MIRTEVNRHQTSDAFATLDNGVDLLRTVTSNELNKWLRITSSNDLIKVITEYLRISRLARSERAVKQQACLTRHRKRQLLAEYVADDGFAGLLSEHHVGSGFGISVVHSVLP